MAPRPCEAIVPSDDEAETTHHRIRARADDFLLSGRA